VKAAVLYGNDDIRYCDYPEPQIRPGYVKIKIHASGICGSDVPRVLKNGAHFYPIVLGHEFSGKVVETGEGVTKVTVGDHVAGVPLLPCMKCADCQKGDYSQCRYYSFIGSREQGSFAEYVVIPEINTVRYNPTIPYEMAAMFEPVTVALHGIMQNNYRGGGNVAILGGGTIGIFSLQWARIFGTKKVVVFDIDDERLALAKRFGADETLNTKEEYCREKAKSFTDNRGYNFVFETAGNPATMLMAFEIAANKAHVCYIGTPSEDVVFTPKQMELMNRKEFRLTGSWMSYSAPFPGREWELAAHYFATGQIKFDEKLIFRRLSLSACSEAFGLYKDPGTVRGKVMFVQY
jgi:L-iditol 2-dehydrogenase